MPSRLDPAGCDGLHNHADSTRAFGAFVTKEFSGDLDDIVVEDNAVAEGLVWRWRLVVRDVDHFSFHFSCLLVIPPPLSNSEFASFAEFGELSDKAHVEIFHCVLRARRQMSLTSGFPFSGGYRAPQRGGKLAGVVVGDALDSRW